MSTCDFLVLGGGIIGVNVARELKRAYPDAKVVVLEKEDGCGRHTSGRNSGVLHAGFYYTADSLKARFTKEGNLALTEFCDHHGIPINKCGKLVVAKDEAELKTMDELIARGKANGIELQSITAAEAREIEPLVATHERALFSPTTSSVDPMQVLAKMQEDALAEGVEFRFSTRYLGFKNGQVLTSGGPVEAGYTVNAAGLYADSIARDFGFSQDFSIVPFKGIYLTSSRKPGFLRTNIYPVPNLKNPFLGVHFTVTVSGMVKIGPTAIPAFWREHYEGLGNFQLGECMEVLVNQMRLLTGSTFDFAALSMEEFKKYSKRHLLNLASTMVTDMDPTQFDKWGKPGLRAQLINIKKKCLEMDFILEADKRSLHVLNAVSPGFTCSIPFSKFVCEEVIKNLG